MILAPIALFVYNRPEHTRLTIEALQRNTLAHASDLYIFSDAAKNEATVSAVNAVRQYIKTITGFKSVVINARDNNLGLANSIIDGVTKMCDEFGKVIVLEDDLLTSPYFLSYMNDGLEKYENEPRVMQISAYMFDVGIDLEEEAFFLPFISSWGWATWGNRWAKFDADAKAYELLKKDKDAIYRFNLDDSYPYFQMLESQLQGKIDSWAIRWNLTVFTQQGLALYPKNTLINNNGFDGTGTHSGIRNGAYNNIKHYPVTLFPSEIAVNESIRKLIFLYLKQTFSTSLICRLRRRCKSLFEYIKS